LLQDPLIFRQNRSYELFWFFHYIFSFFFTVLVVHPHRNHPITAVLTHYSLMAGCSFFVLKVPLNTNQPTNRFHMVSNNESLTEITLPSVHGHANKFTDDMYTSGSLLFCKRRKDIN